MEGPWPRHPLLYEINTVIWLEELSRQAGRPLTLAEVPEEEFRRLARQGWHAVWLMGVWTPSPAGEAIARSEPGMRGEYGACLPDFREEDVRSSPYAVGDYRVAPGLGGPEGLAVFRERLSQEGIRLVLDFVPNHLARDHPWVSECPELFVQGGEEDLTREPGNWFRAPGGLVLAHGRDPYFPGWTDTVQLNHASPATRASLGRALLGVASRCDGVRCDMAMLVLPEVFSGTWGEWAKGDVDGEGFWPEAIRAVRERYPDFVFLAEAYWGLEGRLQEQGFDFTYDKTLYDRLRGGEAAGVRDHLRAEAVFQSRCARFLENHDEPRAKSVFGISWKAPAAVTFFSPGLKLFHEGQLEGRKVRVPVQLRRRLAEESDQGLASAYGRFLEILGDPLFREGEFSLVEVHPAGPGDASHEGLVSFRWWSAGGSAGGRPGFLIVANLGREDAYARIPLPPSFADGTFVFLDRFDGGRYVKEGEELLSPGLFVALGADCVHIFEMTRGDR